MALNCVELAKSFDIHLFALSLARCDDIGFLDEGSGKEGSWGLRQLELPGIIGLLLDGVECDILDVRVSSLG